MPPDRKTEAGSRATFEPTSAMNLRPATLAVLVLAATRIPDTLHADVISDWSRTANDYINQHAPSHNLRGMAMVHVTQFAMKLPIPFVASRRRCRAEAPGAVYRTRWGMKPRIHRTPRS